MMETADACMANDARHRAEMELAGATMLAVLEGKMPAPRELRWSREAGGWGKTRYLHALVSRSMERDRLAEINRTDRDACPRCGARGDVDCGHRRVNGGRLLCL